MSDDDWLHTALALKANVKLDWSNDVKKKKKKKKKRATPNRVCLLLLRRYVCQNFLMIHEKKKPVVTNAFEHQVYPARPETA